MCGAVLYNRSTSGETDNACTLSAPPHYDFGLLLPTGRCRDKKNVKDAKLIARESLCGALETIPVAMPISPVTFDILRPECPYAGALQRHDLAPRRLAIVIKVEPQSQLPVPTQRSCTSGRRSFRSWLVGHRLRY